MRTTLDIDDGLLKAARKRAAESGRTLTAVIEQALFDLLQRGPGSTRIYRIDWTPVEGAGPLVDINDRNSVYDALDDSFHRAPGSSAPPAGARHPARKRGGGKRH